MQNIFLKKAVLFSVMVSIFCFSSEKIAQAQMTISQLTNANFKFHLLALDATTNEPMTQLTKNVTYVVEITNDSPIAYSKVSIQPTILLQGTNNYGQEVLAWVPTGSSGTKLPIQSIAMPPFSKQRITVLRGEPINWYIPLNHGLIENATLTVNLTSQNFSGTVAFTTNTEESIL